MAKFTDERVSAVLQGPRRFRIIDFPGHEEIKVAVRCLTEAELDGCRIGAQVEVRQMASQRGWTPESLVDVDISLIDTLTERQIVWRAFYDPETVDRDGVKPDQFFPSDSDVAGLDSPTRMRLYEAYLEHQDWVSPMRALDEQDVKELAEAIKKEGTSEESLAMFEPRTLRRLLIFTVLSAQSETSPTGKSPGGAS